jgi:hypothetical protein
MKNLFDSLKRTVREVAENETAEMITNKAKNAVKEAAFIVGPKVYDNTKEIISRSPVIKKNIEAKTVEDDPDMDSYIHIDSVL